MEILYTIYCILYTIVVKPRPFGRMVQKWESVVGVIEFSALNTVQTPIVNQTMVIEDSILNTVHRKAIRVLCWDNVTLQVFDAKQFI